MKTEEPVMRTDNRQKPVAAQTGAERRSVAPEEPAYYLADDMAGDKPTPEPALRRKADEGIRPEKHNTEEYSKIKENIFTSPAVSPLSTFSIDVDGAAYANSRRYLEGGSLPPTGAVRIEEFINYFDYDYKQPTGKHPFSVTTETASLSVEIGK